MARKPDNYINKIICGDWEEVIDGLPGGIVHTCATSPPYWGQRNYGVDGQLGLEKTPEEHIDNLVRGFHKFKRVLRNDGTLWVNYGDKYNAGREGGWAGGKNSGFQQVDERYQQRSGVNVISSKPKELLCLPWRVAMALQADGWYLRSVIIWCKAWSFHDCGYETKVIKSEGLFGQELTDVIEEGQNYAGSTMPESVNGWRWERHKVKVKKGKVSRRGDPIETGERRAEYDKPDYLAQWKLCPGCAKCNKHDGWVLRKGSWRPTSAYEYLFMFSKTKSYYADAEAVKEEGSTNSHEKGSKLAPPIDSAGIGHKDWHKYTPEIPSGRNLRNVWCIGTKGYKGAHYATFPEALIEPVIKASTSQKGVCPKCGAPWARMVETKQIHYRKPHYKSEYASGEKYGGKFFDSMYSNHSTTLGWMPTCDCGVKETVPALVYDPFMGSGTTAAVADKLGRHYCGSELNEDYIKEQVEQRLERLWRA